MSTMKTSSARHQLTIPFKHSDRRDDPGLPGESRQVGIERMARVLISLGTVTREALADPNDFNYELSWDIVESLYDRLLREEAKP